MRWVSGTQAEHNARRDVKLLKLTPVDGKTYLDIDSGLLTAQTSKTIDLPVDHAQELKLVILDGGNGKGGDHGSWMDAHLQN